MAVIDAPRSAGLGAPTQIDHLLHVVELEWSHLMIMIQDFKRLDEDDRQEFILEWPTVMARLNLLHAYADGGEMDQNQIKNYHRLTDFILRWVPEAERLLAEVGIRTLEQINFV